jgi:hypothetical protein
MGESLSSSLNLAPDRSRTKAGATWDQFIGTAPQFGERARDQLGTGIAYLATVRKDGAPRLHPVVPIFAHGRLLVAVM